MAPSLEAQYIQKVSTFIFRAAIYISRIMNFRVQVLKLK